MNPKFTLINASNGVTYIQAQSFEFDENTGLGVQKSSLTPVLKEKATEIMQKLATGEYAFTFGAKQRGTLYDGVIAVAEQVEA
jgi:hypothetical protein